MPGAPAVCGDQSSLQPPNGRATIQPTRYISDPAAAPHPRTGATRACKALAMIGVSILIGLALAIATFLSWPGSGGVLVGMLILAAVSAAGGYIAATVMRGVT